MLFWWHPFYISLNKLEKTTKNVSANSTGYNKTICVLCF